MKISMLKQYEQDGLIITNYTKDGEAISHVVKTPVVKTEQIELQPTSEDVQMQTLLNTEYLVVMSELNNI
ncbi:hypothetical protein BTR22_14255 [Alkalihalophilus pseudofirmus]|uniref:hypothetical protein n=1 Tax=Alkalihalophilus pseudofirmus TaxID=79885 RepID=UPI000950C110|nr:hypothetical protein BTR22_14255 [Alkalihalophilus pseudofirmus]